MASRTQIDKQQKWADAEDKVLAYLPEREVDKRRRKERESGKPQYTTIQLPYSYAILSAAHTYWTSVFLSRTPIFQYSARHGESQMQVQAVEALIDYNEKVGEMLMPLYIWLYDAGKYGLGVLGCYWEEDISFVSKIVEEPEMFMGITPTGKKKRRKITERVRGYHGNKLYNIRPQDFLPDPRVPLHDIQRGEFCAIYVEIPWNEVVKREKAGQYTNMDKIAQRSGSGSGTWVSTGGDSARTEGSSQLELPDPSSFTPSEKNTSGTVKAYECYIELIPKDWGLGQGDYPEKWVFTVTHDWSVVLGAQPLGALHNKFPFLTLEIEPEGYSLTNRGIPEIMEPIQNTIDWLVNSHFYNVRKVLNNQFVVDPSRVVMSDVTNPLPGNLIRMKPSAYGQDPKTVMSQLQTIDITQNHMNDLQNIITFGERVSGVNDSVMGVIERGGRRSATEARQEGAFSINRLKTIAEQFSAMGFQPLGQMLIQNAQQYYDAEMKLRLVGDLAQMAGQQFLDVTPETIQGFYDFVPVDGTLPIDRFAQANLWRELFSTIQGDPNIAAQYDMGKIFSWVAQLTGLKNIDQFRVDIQPDGQLQEAARKGDVVPIRGGGAGGSGGGEGEREDMERNLGLRNMPGVGSAG